MARWAVVVLTAYLMVILAFGGWTFWTVWTAEAPEGGASVVTEDAPAGDAANPTPPPDVTWDPPWGASRPLSGEGRLALLVLLIGGLGGTLAAGQSLASYRGEGKLTRSWFLHYWMAPYLGAGSAFILYAVVRAGFLAGTGVQFDGGAAPWGLVAVSALAGLFYDKTLLKLREVFVALFSPRDTRGGKLEDPAPTELTITTTALRPAAVGRAYTARLEAKGGRPPYSWSVEPKLPPGLSLDPLTGVLSGTPRTASAAQDYVFTVRDMARATATATVTFEVR